MKKNLMTATLAVSVIAMTAMPVMAIPVYSDQVSIEVIGFSSGNCEVSCVKDMDSSDPWGDGMGMPHYNCSFRNIYTNVTSDQGIWSRNIEEAFNSMDLSQVCGVDTIGGSTTN